MSMTVCGACDKIKDSDVVQFETILGQEICEQCLPPDDGPVVSKAWRTMFSPASYWPTECPECGRPAMQGSSYCGERCRKIAVGEPSHAEQMADL